MKFQNPSMHSSKLMLCIKKCAIVKMPKVINLDGKKNTGQLFFHEESIYEISKP